MGSENNSIFIAVSNKVKKQIFQYSGKFSSVVPYIVLIMETVEEYEFLDGKEKEEMVIRIARFFDMANIATFDDNFLHDLINKVILASKGKLKINKPKSSSFLKNLFCMKTSTTEKPQK